MVCLLILWTFLKMYIEEKQACHNCSHIVYLVSFLIPPPSLLTSYPHCLPHLTPKALHEEL